MEANSRTEPSETAARRLSQAHHPAEVVFGGTAFLFALFLLVQVPFQTTWVNGTAFVSQPGFIPLVAISGMVVFGAAELFFSWQRNRRADLAVIGRELVGWLRALEFLGWFIAYVLVVPLGGYLPTTMVFCLGLTFRLGYRSRRMLLISILVAFAVVVSFKGFLSVRIPGGELYEYLPAALRNFMIQYL